MKKYVLILSLLGAVLIGGLVSFFRSGDREPLPPVAAVLGNYADIALAAYGDALTTARALQQSIAEFTDRPDAASLLAAREAWKAARIPYQQTEAYRFGNAIVDDWEGKVNAWPLDEGLIDYVATSYGSESDENGFYTANVIANPLLTIGGEVVDASRITPELLGNTLHEIDGVEANVATGYHAIEFLLWGQDLQGAEAGAGQRPVTDFAIENCTGGNCQRRIDYLHAASELLVSDLDWMVGQWGENGAARQALLQQSPEESLATILTGMGSLSYGEMAGERMKLGLILHDPEEEHDCFSDNTHNSHYYDALGIRNVYTGSYERVDGSLVAGPSIAELVADQDRAVDAALRSSLDATLAKMQVLVTSAVNGTAYDQLIADNNPGGNALVQAAIDALLDQTHAIEDAVTALHLDQLEWEGSDSLDNPSAVE